MSQRPLLLKDYLEQDPFSDSSNGFLSFPRKQASSPTVRYLLEAELSGGGARLVRSRSKNALNKLSVIINAVKNFPISSPTRPNIARKFSRRFWSKKKKNGGEGNKLVTVKDIVRLDSFELYGESRSLCFVAMSPVVTSCSGTSCSEVEEGSESFLSSSTSGSLEGFDVDGRRDSSVEKSPSHRQQSPSSEKQEIENQGIECEQCRSKEEKEQLSPVSIMDFPDDEEEENDEVTSPCFEQNLAKIERTTHQLLQKIRRFESLAELDLLDLDIHFPSDDEQGNKCDVASSDEITAWDWIRRLRASSDEITAWDWIRRLRFHYHVDPRSEKLLLDFMMEGLSLTVGDIEWLIIAAGDWIDGRGFLKKEEHSKDQLNEMERNGRWGFFEDGKDDVAAYVEGGVLESLIQELVIDLGME